MKTKDHSHTLLLAALCLGMTSIAGCAGDDEGDAVSQDVMDTEDINDPSEEVAETDGGEETGGSEETGDDAVDPLAGCSRDVLEDDLVIIDTMGAPGPVRWYGPGADADSGELLDRGSSTYVVSATYLALQPTEEAATTFLSLVPELNEALFTNPGMVAVQLGDSRNCGVARTLTVWTDEDAMMEFVTSDAHLAAMGEVTNLSRGGSVVTSWTAPASEIDWDMALDELSKVESRY